MPLHDIPHGAAIQRIAQLEQLALDLVKTQAWIFARQANNQRFQFRFDPRPSIELWSLERPFSPHELPLPLQQCIWLDQQYTLLERGVKTLGYASESVRQHNQHQLFRSGQPRFDGCFAF